MDAKPLLNLFLTFASPKFQNARHFDCTICYPVNLESFAPVKGNMPRTMLVALPENGLTFDECLDLMSKLNQRLRECSIKVNADMDIQYCCLLSEENATQCEFIMSYPAV